MCSVVPNASPGTTTTWASLSSFAARSAGGGDAAFADEFADVRVNVEGTLGNGTGEAGDGLEAFKDAVAEFDVVGTHFADALLRAMHGCDGGALHHAGGVRGALRL